METGNEPSFSEEIDMDGNGDGGGEDIYSRLRVVDSSEPSSSYSPSRSDPPSAVGGGSVKDSEGFLTPPPASTLLIRRTRNNSAGSSTYVIASPPAQGQGGTPLNMNLDTPPLLPPSSPTPTIPPLPLDMHKEFPIPYRRLHKHTRSPRDRRSDPTLKRVNFDKKKVNVLLTPQQGPHVQINVPYQTGGNGPHLRSSFPPISPLAIDPSHALSVTLSSDRSISTVVPIDTYPSTSSNPFLFQFQSIHSPPSSNQHQQNQLNMESKNEDEESSLGSQEYRPIGFRGKPTTFLSTSTKSGVPLGGGGGGGKGTSWIGGIRSGKVMKRRRGERGPDRFPNIDPATGRRRYIRKKRFTLDKRQTTRGRLQGRAHSGDGQNLNYDHELTGKWRPTDDLRLIVNVLQVGDLEMVHRGVRFSCKFTLDNIERRWAGLLYDKAIFKVSQNSIQNLHPRVVVHIHENALFSPDEDRVLKTVRSTHEPSTLKPVMEKLLKDHALVFINWRSPKCLIEHWLLLREYHLLSDQNVKDYFEQESFSDFEDNLTEQDVRQNNELDPNVRREMLLENRHAKKLIRTLEEEVSRWQVLANMVTGLGQTPFEEGSFAMLRGKQVRYLMRSREITLGRRTPDSLNIDADLSLEGSTYKVSRKQATIQLRTLGDFVILNQGKHGIYVDGNVIMPRRVGALVDQSVIEISHLRFVFVVNHKLVGEQRKKWIRVEVKKEMLRLSKIARFIKAHPAYPIPHPTHPLPFSSGGPSGIGVRTTDQVVLNPIQSYNSNNTLATIDSVASNVGGESSSTTTRFTGSLTRPPQPPKSINNGNRNGGSSGSNFIKTNIPPPPPPSIPSFIPRITSTGPVFRKPTTPPSPLHSYESTFIPPSVPRGFPTTTSGISTPPPPPPHSNSTIPSLSAISIRAPPKVEKMKGPKTTKHVSIHSMKSTSSYPMSPPLPPPQGAIPTLPSSSSSSSSSTSSPSPSSLSSTGPTEHPVPGIPPGSESRMSSLPMMSVVPRTQVVDPVNRECPPEVPPVVPWRDDEDAVRPVVGVGGMNLQSYSPMTLVLTPLTLSPSYTLTTTTTGGIDQNPNGPTILITPSSSPTPTPTPVQIPGPGDILNDLTIRPGHPPSSQDYKINPL